MISGIGWLRPDSQKFNASLRSELILKSFRDGDGSKGAPDGFRGCL